MPADSPLFTLGPATLSIDGKPLRRSDYHGVVVRFDERPFRRYGKELTAIHSPELDRLLSPATVVRKALGEFDA
jgi:hypothetical protein